MTQLGPNKLTKLIKTVQFYWFLSHVFTVLFFIVTTFTSFFAPASSLKYYRFCLLLILTTYVIVIRQLKKKGVYQLLGDENVQYFILASSLYLSSFKIGAISGSLYSFIIFSVFHILNYFQNNLLEVFFNTISAQQAVHASINHFVTTYNQQALLMAANAEILLLLMGVNPLLQLPSILSSLFSGDLLNIIVKLFMFVVVLAFNKIRYDSNQCTKMVFDQWDMKIQQFLAGFPQYSGIYNVQLKGLMRKYITPIKVPVAPVVKNKKN